MKIIRYLLAAVITLSFVAGCILPMTGYNGIQGEHLVSAASAADKEFTVKPASDFALRLPAKWKHNYVMEKSKGKKQGSYVSFSAQKCYQETGEGWLFSIMRFKDDSYTDLPQYELVGKWNGISYVAVFSTDVQTMGASKAAKKQYNVLAADAEKAAASIRPLKKRKKGKGVYRTSDFSLKLPAAWKNNYIVEIGGTKKKDFFVAFYAKKCYRQNKQGWLFSIEEYQDESYQELPAYELVGKWNGISYVAVFPTDVQFEGATKEAARQYKKLSRFVEMMARSIQR